VKVRELLMARARARDIPIDEIMEDADVAAKKVQAQQEAASKAQDAQAKLLEAQVQDLFAKALASVAKAHKDDAKIELDATKLVLQAIGDGHAADVQEADTRVKAATALHAINNPPKGASNG
jgi:hypothetical protein